jgi:Cu2+-containing amine oxidase
MTKARFAASLLGVALLTTFIVAGAAQPPADPQPPAKQSPQKQPPEKQPPEKQPPGKDPKIKQPAPPEEIIQEFPVGGEMQTAWKIQYMAHSGRKGGNPGPGLTIVSAWFKTGPKADWLKVVSNIRLSEIFVPYNNGTRIFDIGSQGNYGLLTHTKDDAGINGKLLHGGTVVQELRDTGVMWKYYKQVRRGQEVALWSTIAAANYNYLIEFSFRNDGTIVGRMGSTGRNFGNHETIGHMHSACWRIDVDLGDHTKNNAFLVRRVESKGAGREQGKDVVTPFNGGVEGGAEWNPREFTRLRVESDQKNGNGKPVSYELWPHARPGTPRHWAAGDEFAQNDYWVTPQVWAEQYYGSLPKFVKQNRKITDTDLVVWYMSPAYHLPRDEDGIFMGPNGRIQVRGVALTTWCGFELRPRNVFDKTPLYP